MATVAPELPALSRDGTFEALYRRYVGDVYHYTLALLRNPADAEDVTQTTFMNAYRALQRGEKIEKPQNWLIKIAHNAARSRYARANRRVKEVPLEDHVDQLAVPEDEKPDVQAVLDALGRLPLNQRAAIVMRELEGRTYAEIADTLNVSVPAVETLIFRARKSLRLRASAIRALAAVPLPGSLAQFFDAGGTAVVGGGAAIGTGFVVKAAVALVAGLVATSVGGDKTTHTAAAAAAPPAVQVSATTSSKPVAPRSTRPRHALRITAARHHVRASSSTSAHRPRAETYDAGVDLAASSTGSSTSGETRAASSGATSGGSSAPAPATDAVAAVGSAVNTVSSSLPPVSTPQLPPIPPPPPVPKLP